MRTTLMSRALPAVVLGAAILNCVGARQAVTDVNPATVGDLSRPVSQMTGGDIWDETRDLGWVKGETQPRNCAQGRCDARMDAIRGQEELNAERISPNGTIVARFVNRGAGIFNTDRGPEARYGFAKTDATDYFLIAIRDSVAPHGWKWIVRVAFKGDQGMIPMRTGDWGLCQRDQHNPDHPPAGTKTQFYKCNYPTQNGHSVARLAYNLNDPGWYDCEQGCCTAGVQ